MKRTFGRFMSLLLVLAMVLAMVPAALAANQAYSVEPDSTIKIKTSITGFTVTNWESSDESVATVAAVSGSKTEAIVTGKKASNTGHPDHGYRYIGKWQIPFGVFHGLCAGRIYPHAGAQQQ